MEIMEVGKIPQINIHKKPICRICGSTDKHQIVIHKDIIHSNGIVSRGFTWLCKKHFADGDITKPDGDAKKAIELLETEAKLFFKSLDRD